MNISDNFLQTPDYSQRQLAKVYARISLSSFMQLSENEFADFIRNVEATPLFQRLMRPAEEVRKNEKIIRYARLPASRITSFFYDFSEIKSQDIKGPDIESFLCLRKNFIPLIKKIGSERFKKYFLYGDLDSSLQEIARQCALTLSDVKKLISFVEEMAVKLRFCTVSTLASPPLRYRKIAYLRKEKGRITIDFFDLHLGRGLYEIDYKRLAQLENQGVFSPKEIQEINQLIRKLMVINVRKSTLFRILNALISYQKRFLMSADYNDLSALTQKYLATELGISASLFNRALKGKSLELPWHEEVPFKFLFPSLKKKRKFILAAILKEDKKFISDEALRQELIRRHGIYLSRRSIAQYRKEIAYDN